MTAPDPKPPARVHSPATLSILHHEWRECALCGQHRGRLSLHHIHKHPRDDVRPNLVMLCGSGTTGCHGDIEGGVRERRRELGLYLLNYRPDTLEYLATKLKGEVQARAWIQRALYVEA